MVSKKDSNKQRLRRHKRVRGAVSGTAQRPRLNVFRSSKNIFAQVIDDVQGVTLAAASTTEKDFSEYGGNKEAARKVGKLIAERALARVSRLSYLTAAVTYTMAVSRNSQKVPVRAA